MTTLLKRKADKTQNEGTKQKVNKKQISRGFGPTEEAHGKETSICEQLKADKMSRR